MKPKFISTRRLALISVIAFTVSSHAASLTWDSDTGTTGAQDGSGTWTTGAGGWWNGTTNVNWAASDSAIFGAGTDAGGKTIILGGAISPTGGNATTGGLHFANSGYTLSAASALSITYSNVDAYLTVAADKSATIGANVTVLPASTRALFIGGSGTLKIQDGGIVRNPSGTNALVSIIGGATVNVGTTGSLQSVSNQFIIGRNEGSGTLIVSGGSVTGGTTASNFVLANSTAGNISGELRIDTGSVVFGSTSGGLRVGSTSAGTGSSTGTVNLNGGSLEIARIYEGGGSGVTISSTVNLNGGTLKVRSGTTNGANFMAGLDSANVLSGGAVIDTNGVATTIAQALLDGTGDGGLTKKGNGTLTLTGANTYTGPTIIDGGKIAITAPYSSLTDTTINSGSRLLVNTAATASAIPEITVNTDGGFETNVGIHTIGQLAGLSTATFNALGNYKVDLTGAGVPVGDITVLSYTSKTGGGVPSLGTVPPGVTGTVEDTGSAIIIHVLTPQVPSYVWSAGSGAWDTTTANWTGATYTEGAVVTFPDLAGYNVVNLTADRSPLITTISNATAKTYKFTGSSIAGSSTLTKSNTGAAILSAANSYSGLTTISAGALLVGADNALGSTTAGTTVTSGAFLGLKGGITYTSLEPVTGSGVGNLAAITAELNDDTLAAETLALQRGFIQSSAGNNTFAGPVQITATDVTRIGVQDGAQLTLTGPITKSTGVTGVIVLFRGGLNDGDFITLSNSGNSWDGETRIFAGNNGTGAGLKLGIDNGLPAATTIVGGGNSSGTGNSFELNGFDQTLNGLTNSNGTLHIVNNGTSSSTLTLNPTVDRDTTTILATMTTIEDGAEKILLVKDGLFKQTLYGAHTYSGSTAIKAGTLALTANGTIDNTESVTISAGATFDVSAKTGYTIPTGKTFTLKLDGTSAGTAGKIKAAGLDISNATVVLDPITTLDDAVYILAEYTATTLTGSQFLSVNAIPGYTIDYAYNSGTRIALVQNAVAGYSSWIAKAEFGLAPADRDPGDDPDNDGMDNLLEFVLNGDPSASDSSILPALTVTATDFEFVYQRRDDSVFPETTQTFEWGTNLATWPGAAVVPAASGLVPPAIITVSAGVPDDAVTDTVKVSIPKTQAGGGGKLFGRLTVVKP